jgi:hypothetical protein
VHPVFLSTENSGKVSSLITAWTRLRSETTVTTRFEMALIIDVELVAGQVDGNSKKRIFIVSFLVLKVAHSFRSYT